MEGSTSIYILHIISNINNPFDQKSFMMCINDFINNYHGHFESGSWVPEPFDVDHVQYHLSDLQDGYLPPAIIVDVIQYLKINNLWVNWMANFDRIMITRRYIDQ